MKDSLTFEEVPEILDSSVNKPFKEYKVMVIDDDDDVRGLLESQLGKYFTISTAANGAEGLEKLGDEQPDIVVCDVMMPEMDGFEFTKRLKSNFNISHIPVILLTAYSSEEHQLKGIRAGADSYITKPFSVKYLLMRIVKLIEQREKLQRKFETEPGALQPFINTTDRDKAFMKKLDAVIEKNMGDAEFKLETYASVIGIGRTTFYGKLKSIVGCAPNEYVRILRMKKAAELLLTTDLNIAEIGFQVGINDPFYFSRCFKKSFGKSPLQYRKEPVKTEVDTDMKSCIVMSLYKFNFEKEPFLVVTSILINHSTDFIEVYTFLAKEYSLSRLRYRSLDVVADYNLHFAKQFPNDT